MDFSLTEEQQDIQKAAADIASRLLAPKAEERDKKSIFPLKELKLLAEAGLMGISVPEAFGGIGADSVSYFLALREIAKADASVAVTVSVTNMVGELIAEFGSEEQKKEHIPKLLDGSYVCGSFALSEPGAGSDPSAMRAKAEKVDGGYRLTGTKQWISHGDHAGIIIVWAQTDPSKGVRGLSAFLVPKGATGLSVGKAEDKMGLRGSTTVQLVFDDVMLPASALLGKEGQGFKLAMMALDGGRIGISAQAQGIGQAALEAAVNYAVERKQFDVAIIKHQAIGNMLADCATWLDAAEVLALSAAYKKSKGLPFTKEASMSKVFSSEKAVAICDAALQVHGGYGYTKDYEIERLYRDVRVTKIYEGTSEIQRIVIGRQLEKEATQ